MGRAEQKFTITTEVRKILLDYEPIRTAIGTKVFPVVASEGTDGDFIAYFRDEYSLDYSKMGITSQRCTIVVSAVSEDYDRSQELARWIFEALQGDFKDPEMRIRMIDSTEDFADKKYLQILKFTIE